LRSEILDMGGTAQLLVADALAGDTEIVATFNEARDEEYAEFIGRCDDFLAEVDKETRAAKFTYAELEEIDEDLIKLRGWLTKVTDRDTFAAPLAGAAAEALARCEDAFEAFTQRVYDANADE
jgi:ABC-type taurine transport system substrate-binding protein